MTYWYAPYWEETFAVETVEELVNQVCQQLDEQLKEDIARTEKYDTSWRGPILRPSRISSKATIKEKYGKITISKNSYTYFKYTTGEKYSVKHMASVTVCPLSKINS